jgi:uncharacterized iron-regulated protein
MPKLSLLILLAFISACTHVASIPGHAVAGEQAMVTAAPSIESSPVLDLSAFSTMEQIIPALADKQVVFVGEQHARYDHHLTQLEIIRRLYARHPQLAIGMEMFQQPFQRYLDEYIAGDIDEQSMLRSTEYYRRWRMDFRHYAPILRYAREHGLPVIALNVPGELTRKVGDTGLDSLSDEERRQLPDDIAPADAAYRDRIKTVFDYHPNNEERNFEHFLEAQLLWDAGMAERAAAFLAAYPDHHLVVIAGNQHLAWGGTMPQRVQQRAQVTTAVILNSWQGPVGPGLADFLLLPEERPLPTAGKMGALLKEDKGQVTIASCLEDSPCEKAGIKAGDRITAIDSNPINSTADLSLAMLGKQRGDIINLDTIRKRLFLQDKALSYKLKLQ